MITSLREIHTALGKSYNPLKEGRPPSLRIKASAAASMALAVAPGLTSGRICSSVRATIRLAALIFSISSTLRRAIAIAA